MEDLLKARTPNEYRSVPYVITAMRWFGDNYKDVLAFIGDNYLDTKKLISPEGAKALWERKGITIKEYVEKNCYNRADEFGNHYIEIAPYENCDDEDIIRLFYGEWIAKRNGFFTIKSNVGFSRNFELIE